MRKEITLILTSVFILVYGTYIAGTILTPFAESLGAPGITIGFISGALYIVRLLTGTWIGKLSDKRGVLNVLKYSLVLYPFVAFSYWAAWNIPALIGARLLHGLASAMMLPMAMAYIGEVTPQGKEGHYMGIYNTIILIASGLGPQTATLLAARYSTRTGFLFLFILAFISLIIILMVQRNRAGNQISSTLIERSTKYRNSSRLIKNPSLLALASINIALAVISSMIGFFFILYPPTKGIDLIFTGSIIAIYNIVCGVVQIPLGQFTDKFNKRRMIIIAGMLTTAILILFPFVGLLWTMCLAMLALAIASAVLLSASSALSAIIGHNMGMGITMGFLGTSTSIGMILGSILLGLMPDNFGIDSIFYLAGGLVLVCTTIFSILWRKKQAVFI